MLSKYGSYQVGSDSVVNINGCSDAVLSKIFLRAGSRCVINIAGITVLHNQLRIHMRDDCVLDIAEDQTFNGYVEISQHESSKIAIGKGCLFSTTRIWSSDMHSILDCETNDRVNPAADILIGKRVWVGFDAIILKGSVIGDDSIVSVRAVVAGGAYASNCVLAGVPAKIVRSGVKWNMSLM